MVVVEEEQQHTRQAAKKESVVKTTMTASRRAFVCFLLLLLVTHTHLTPHHTHNTDKRTSSIMGDRGATSYAYTGETTEWEVSCGWGLLL